MANRIPRQWYFLKMANLVSERGTCIRRKVGCVLTNKLGHVLATGYNGVPANSKHCIDEPCSGAKFTSGEGLEECQAIHAEQNALIQCKNNFEIDSIYCTLSPCITCVKLFLNTSAKHIYFLEKYIKEKPAKNLWLANGGETWTFIRKELILPECSKSLN